MQVPAPTAFLLIADTPSAELRPASSSWPEQSPRPPSVHDGNFQIYEPVTGTMSPPIKQEFVDDIS